MNYKGLIAAGAVGAAVGAAVYLSTRAAADGTGPSVLGEPPAFPEDMLRGRKDGNRPETYPVSTE